MAGIIATEKQAASIGGGSSYTSSLMVTKTRAVALGCSIRNSYTNTLLVCHGDLYKPGYTYCTCNAQCTCNLVCTSVSGKTTCTCNNDCTCKSLLTWCRCQNYCTCNVTIKTFSCPEYKGSITLGTNCTTYRDNSGGGEPGFDCGKWCFQNWCYTNSYTVLGYSGSNWCQGHCYSFTTCSCNSKCTCNTEAKQSSSTCACNTYCPCNANGCTCKNHCTCNTVCGCDKDTCNCLGQCSCQNHCTCNSVS